MGSPISQADWSSTRHWQGEAPLIALPNPKSQEMVLVRRSELQAAKRTAVRAGKEPSALAGAGWMTWWLGIGVSTLVGLIALLGVDNQVIAPGVIAGLTGLILVSFFLAGFLWFVNRAERTNKGTAMEELQLELDQLDKRAP